MFVSRLYPRHLIHEIKTAEKRKTTKAILFVLEHTIQINTKSCMYYEITLLTCSKLTF